MTASREEMQRMLQSVQKMIRARTVGTTDSSSLEHRGPSIGESKRSAAGAAQNEDDEANKTKGESVLNAKDNQTEFVKYYYRVIRSFIEDKSKYRLELPDLTGFDRRVVHSLAEKCNLSHSSVGEGEQRVLQLKKDVLFFHNPDVVRSVDLDDVLAKACGKESKFHLRYARRIDPAQLPAGAIGSYADEDALRKIERLRRATDEYRHATTMGYTQEELMAAEENGVEPALQLLQQQQQEHEHSVTGTGTGAMQNGQHQQPNEYAAANASEKAEVTRRRVREDNGMAHCDTSTRDSDLASLPVAAQQTRNETTRYEEVCRCCGSRALVDYEISRWVCSKYCAVCMRNTIWNFAELSNTDGQPSASCETNTATTATSEDTAAVTQSSCRADASADVARGVEEIDHEEDELVTVEDVVEMAAMNDFSASDVNWLRRFATLHASHLNESVVFCIDFRDLCELRIFERYSHQVSAPLPHHTNESDHTATYEESNHHERPRDGNDSGAENDSVHVSRRRRLEKGDQASDHGLQITSDSRYSPYVCYAVVRESRALQRSLTSLLEELINKAFVPEQDHLSDHSGTPDAGEEGVVEVKASGSGGILPLHAPESHARRCMEHVGLAFPNTSVYGVEAVAVCQLRPALLSRALVDEACQRAPSVMRVDMMSLYALQREYGEEHCYIARTLDDALSHAN